MGAVQVIIVGKKEKNFGRQLLTYLNRDHYPVLESDGGEDIMGMTAEDTLPPEGEPRKAEQIDNNPQNTRKKKGEKQSSHADSRHTKKVKFG